MAITKRIVGDHLEVVTTNNLTKSQVLVRVADIQARIDQLDSEIQVLLFRRSKLIAARDEMQAFIDQLP